MFNFLEIKKIAYFATILALSVISFKSLAVIEAYEFDTVEKREQYQGLIAELRCLVCQNQNLADSNAELAQDLRKKTYEMVSAGNSNQEVLDYMKERYGDFVLYRPPFDSKTLVLWIGPFILLSITLLVLFINIRAKQQKELMRTALSNNQEQQTKVRNLLRDTPSLDDDTPKT
jgi:cytochrome c-type biogenesis protein CcmH